MSDDRPVPFEGAADLRRMLRELGQSPTDPPRGVDAERAREERLAAGLDAELERLVRERRQQRWAIGALVSAAAILVLAWGLRRSDSASAIAIAQEPVAARSVVSSAPAAEPPGPATSPVVTQPLAPPPRTVASPSSSSSSSPPASAKASPPTPLPDESTLGEENRLFKAAAEASRGGNVASAIQLLDQLLTQYPRSPLAQTALVRKFRLLADAGRTAEATREAERYLSLYPTGFAVSEAQALGAREVEGRAAPDAPQEHPAPRGEEPAYP